VIVDDAMSAPVVNVGVPLIVPNVAVFENKFVDEAVVAKNVVAVAFPRITG
jgi:hypothetical protein